jgi:Lar family restriction alleviation protein
MTEGTDKQSASAPVHALVLLPCPFCGAKAYYSEFTCDYGQACTVDCSECPAIIETSEKHRTLENWNRRMSPTQLPKPETLSYQESMSRYYAAIRSQ